MLPFRELEGWIPASLCPIWSDNSSHPLFLDFHSVYLKKYLEQRGKPWKAIPCFLILSSLPANHPQPRKSCLIHFQGIIRARERHICELVDQTGDSLSALLCLWGPFGVLVYTFFKGVELYFFLQVNITAWSVFRMCFKNPGEIKMFRTLWIPSPVLRCCFFTWGEHFSGLNSGECCSRLLSWVQNVNDWLTACCQTGNVL